MDVDCSGEERQSGRQTFCTPRPVIFLDRKAFELPIKENRFSRRPIPREFPLHLPFPLSHIHEAMLVLIDIRNQDTTCTVSYFAVVPLTEMVLGGPHTP